MESLKFSINPARLPTHIAIIMDGNGSGLKCRVRTDYSDTYHGVEMLEMWLKAVQNWELAI